MDLLGIVGVAAGSVAIPLAAVSTATSVASISQGASAQQAGSQGGGGGGAPDPKNDPRLAKFSLRVRSEDAELHSKIVVLRDGRLWLDDSDPSHRALPSAHPFAGFFIEYPVVPPNSELTAKPRGLVSTIAADPPELNWVYADADTLQLRYGNKTASQGHVPGPWDWTDDEQALVLEEWEGFVAMEEEEEEPRRKRRETRSAPSRSTSRVTASSRKEDPLWGLYYDEEDDLLEGLRRELGRPNARVVEVSLERRISR